MLRNLLLTLCIILTSNLLVFSQSGALKGKITDKTTGEPIPFANVIVELGGTQVNGASSDFDGNYLVKPISPGKYDVKATYVGYKTLIVEGVIISSDKITFYNLEMVPKATQLEEVEVKSYKVPLISKDQTQTGATVTSEEIDKMPNRSANAVATTVGGVFSRDGERGNVRGARSDGTVMYIDGIRVRGSQALPQSSIEQVSVILGGLPAQYGDATGGVINVTTKGPSRKFGAGMELETSEFLDAFGYNRLGLNVNGPIFTKKNERGELVSSLLGYFVAGDFTYREDGHPSAIGIYKAKDDVLDHLEENPLRPSGLASGGTFQNAEFITYEDLKHVKTTQNTSSYNINISGKIDVKTSRTTNLTFGGQFIYNNYHNYSYTGSLLNYDKNLHVRNSTWRVFGRFTQRFPTGGNPVVKNVYYSLQLDYSRYHQVYQDPDHKDDLFKYGYLGKFDVYKTPTYELGTDTLGGQVYSNVEILRNWQDTLVTFGASDFNHIPSRWVTTYYDLFEGQPVGNYQNFDQIQLGGGIINGQQPSSVYGLYQSPGAIQGYWQYGVTDNSQIGFNGLISYDIWNIEFKTGIQFEKRTDRAYGYNATGLWDLIRGDRGYTNAHIREINPESAEPVYIDGVFQDTINYLRKFDGNSQYWFDKNLREKLDLERLDFIIPNSYDFANRTITYYDSLNVMHTIQLDEDLFSIDMFSPDELFQDGNNPKVFYRGYTYTGKKLKTKPSFDDFFNETNDDGMYTRPIGAYEPIYLATFQQMKFAFRDLIFNIGVRVDRFDANQPVLKDPYLLYPAKTVADLTPSDKAELGDPDIPNSIGNDYVVYVDNAEDPTRIVGYRKGDVWYNASGFEVQDVTTLAGSTGLPPLLFDKDQDKVTKQSFKDYEPQWSVMPRISFSFPISDEALFFAHYDVLTQRPTSRVISTPNTYWFFSNIGGTINNPSLKPSKTIDYELGFQQRLTNTSSITITAFYREMRDMIQIYRYTGAYPKDYTSYSNLDFGTVKGLTVTYDLRRTKNARVRAAYTLQFADATGASPTTAAALVASGLPNLRTTNPLPWDRRHQINLLIDYRYSEGKDYNGPTITRKSKKTDKVKNIQLLKNTGFSLTFNGGSGTPYTASQNITSPISGGSRILEGTYYGSRLPWQFRMDAKVDKEIYFKNERRSYLNIYLQVLNVLNTKNVMNVYPFTGNPDDDGYLAAAEWQSEIEEQVNPQSFKDLYSIYVNNPNNYSSPRMIRLGLIFNF